MTRNIIDEMKKNTDDNYYAISLHDYYQNILSTIALNEDKIQIEKMDLNTLIMSLDYGAYLLELKFFDFLNKKGINKTNQKKEFLNSFIPKNDVEMKELLLESTKIPSVTTRRYNKKISAPTILLLQRFYEYKNKSIKKIVFCLFKFKIQYSLTMKNPITKQLSFHFFNLAYRYSIKIYMSQKNIYTLNKIKRILKPKI